MHFVVWAATASLEVLTCTPPLDLLLSEVLCQEAARLQRHSAEFPLLTLVNQLASHPRFLKSSIRSPLHSILNTIHDLDLSLGNIEKLPTRPLQSHLDLHQPTIHKGPVRLTKKSEWSDHDKFMAKVYVLNEVLDIPPDIPVAFTDGSALGNPGPCGGAAVV